MRVLGCWIDDLAAGLADYFNADYVDVVAFSTATLPRYAVLFSAYFLSDLCDWTKCTAYLCASRCMS
ncbi:MAG: hypothetical protein ACRC43_02430, partial [Plesiomonas shigelloides]